MKNLSSRRGSALLIVLGMMSFIIVSAVAFSAYMRYSRLPSSYLRRTSSSRLLVKAALAEAIDIIDASIGNNPYPGFGDTRYSRNGSTTYNTWYDRVFIGDESTCSTSDTVSPLAFEGLAYIPPPFINEVRYWSRRSPAASWHTMSFDAGRFAFAAVNVSDCYDVNRLKANVPRDSSDENRITLSHVFEKHVNDGDTGDEYSVDPEKWDQFMDNFRDKNHTKVPLVSVADYNLAVADQIGGEEAEYLSPFYTYLQKDNNANFVVSANDKKAAAQRNFAFVTDSYFPVTNRNSNAINIANKSDQPFEGFKLMKKDDEKQNDDTLEYVIQEGESKFLNHYAKQLKSPEVVQLYDYLDADSVPLSLALPTVERTPMITGVALQGDLQLVLSKTNLKDDIPVKDNQGNIINYYTVKTKTLSLVSLNGLTAKAGCIFPFKYSHGTDKKFYAQAAATIVLVKEDDANDKLRRPNAAKPAVITKNDWKTSQVKPSQPSGDEIAGIITMQSSKQTIEMPSQSVTEEEDAILKDVEFDFGTLNIKFEGDFADPGIGDVLLPDNMKQGTFMLVQKLDKNKSTVLSQELKPSPLKPYNVDLSGTESFADGSRYVPIVQLWVRIFDENDKVVDLVPACAEDDEKVSGSLAEVRCAADRPLLRFKGMVPSGNNAVAPEVLYGTSIFNNDGAEERPMTIYPQAYMADDPRFNFAPENMLAVAEFSDKTFEEYFEEQILPRAKNRDGDIFMMTSDTTFLQSGYELMSLLNVSGLDGDNSDPLGSPAIASSAYNGVRRCSGFDTLAATSYMWRTYDHEDIRELDIANSSRGFRINPYTEDVNILLSAFANTPIDWWAASTNDQITAKESMLKDLDAANKYTFSAHASSVAKVKHGAVTSDNTYKSDSGEQGTLVNLAQAFKNRFRYNSNRTWETAFDQDDTWDKEDEIAGVNLGLPLHSVDKKYLYGYWRECFANQQQLFLIFVRAEPMMLGGGGVGQTPPQLGARAVALVWRDPTATRSEKNNSVAPHRTRLLFYRQFD